MFTIDIVLVKIALSLVLLICANILLGSMNAILARQFDKTKFVNGLLKGLVVALAILLVYVAGLLVPNIVIMQIDGQDVTLVMALSMLLVASLLFYGKENIGKIASFINAKFGDNTSKTVNNYIENKENGSINETFTAIRASDRSSGDEPPSTI
ncbi:MULTISPECIES: hypothetical protein [unclassified Dehalobacter]|uniref:hypothetical protein n=1 Tax=unclassified Dehalobacter TaxID=2635733 RepID=UPI001053E284|nr:MULTISPECIES: hypothetical protein [unclassified Dehalobacter]TCX51913.1 hypothetical protein C1I36_06230 [Dehalobacter sp. 14DCB1]TCX52973.1 hypothetical protein C1I38_07910 [Dehalobacter sp. 12DCB1]